MTSRAFELTGALNGNVRRVSPSYHHQLVTADPDDNAFVDCAIAAEADYIVTEDHHFDALIGSGYKPRPIQPDAFVADVLSSDGSS